MASRVLPVLEYGLNWHKPDKKSCLKLDLFIRKAIRSLTGSPRYLPNEDLSNVFQFSSFYQRWEDLHARFLNHRAYKDNEPSMVTIQSKAPWAFQVNKNLAKLINEEPIVKKIILRKFIDPIPAEATCTNCGKHHLHVNQHIQCRFKDFTPFLLNNEDKSPIPKITIPTPTIATMAAKLKKEKDNRLHIYTDASYCPLSNKSNGGILIFSNSGTTKHYGISNTHLNIQSSTRGEIATIVEAINRSAKGKKVKIYTDSKNAIEAFGRYKDGSVCYSKIESIDLWIQLEKDVEMIELKKVTGHKKDKLNNFVDTVANLVFQYNNSKLKRLKTICKVKRSEQDKSHFRIHDLIKSIKERKLKKKDYLLECVDLGEWFAMATALAVT